MCIKAFLVCALGICGYSNVVQIVAGGLCPYCYLVVFFLGPSWFEVAQTLFAVLLHHAQKKTKVSPPAILFSFWWSCWCDGWEKSSPVGSCSMSFLPSFASSRWDGPRGSRGTRPGPRVPKNTPMRPSCHSRRSRLAKECQGKGRYGAEEPSGYPISHGAVVVKSKQW